MITILLIVYSYRGLADFATNDITSAFCQKQISPAEAQHDITCLANFLALLLKNKHEEP